MTVLGKVSDKKKTKVVALGLDGVPCTLLKRFADEGVMPQVATLLREGTLCSMNASIPEVSSTSWSTFMTGVNPGRHGIYGFMELHRDTYAWKFPNFDDLRSKTLWEIAGEHGRRSIVVNIPSTYPAKPLKGMLVAGFVALDLRKASYPDALFRYLNGIGYRLDVDAGKAAYSMDEFAKDIMGAFRKRAEAILHLIDTEEWDLFIAAVTETDRLHHYLWAALDAPSHPQHAFFIDYYRELDGFIGDLYGKIGSDTPFIILSDHGFTTIKKEVYLNAFLREKGYLKFTAPAPRSFEAIDVASKAFVLDPSRVYLHLKGVYSRGRVALDEYDALRCAIKNDLLSLTIDGERVIKRVFLKEELYEGACFDAAPDLVVLPEEGYDMKGSLAHDELSGRSLLTGGHTRENAVLYMNRKINCDSPSIVDVGSTILKLLAIPAETLDGRSLV